MKNELRNLVDELEQDRSLDEPDRLCARVEALDRLEKYLLDSDETHQCAQAVAARLEAANRELYQSIRQEIQRGAGREPLLPWIHKAIGAQGEGYDYLDELIIGILQLEDHAIETHPVGSEMVFYQPTPARHIFDLINRTALSESDVLIDLGSGLGHISLLASICTGARCIGIELEPAYVTCARHSAKGLNLSNVTFLQQDAREADLSQGTVFYLYTPFSGTILRSVLDALRGEAARRPIRVCTFGPCTQTIAEEQWLESTGTSAVDQIAVFRTRTAHQSESSSAGLPPP